MINLVDGKIKKEIIIIKMVYYNKVIIQIINNLIKIKIKMILMMIKLLINFNKCSWKKNKESLENKNQSNKKNKSQIIIINH
jgi:hypothetical protein